MNIRYRMSCIYDIVYPFPTYDIVYIMWRWTRTMSYVDVRHRTSRTISHVRCRTSTSCISHVRHRTCNVQHDVVCRTYDIVRAWRTTSHVTYDIVGGKNPDVQYPYILIYDPISGLFFTQARKTYDIGVPPISGHTISEPECTRYRVYSDIGIYTDIGVPDIGYTPSQISYVLISEELPLANRRGCIEGCIGCINIQYMPIHAGCIRVNFKLGCIQIIGGCTEMYCRMY
jgi:hypothetical protein